MIFQVKVSDNRLIQLITMFEKSGLVYPWWAEDSLEEKSAKLLGWLQEDHPCQMLSAEKSKPLSGDRS